MNRARRRAAPQVSSLAGLGIAVLFCLGLMACAGGPGASVFTPGDPYDGTDARPWTHLDFANDPDNFQFVIITDRTGDHRPGVFPAILEKVNLMQPELIMSVGDYVEGYTDNRDELLAQWAEVDGYIDELEAPFFHVVGNHDIGNSVMEEVWKGRHERLYYHFIYRDVLFIALNTEDPPPVETPESKTAWAELFNINQQKGSDAAQEFLYESDALQIELGQIGDEQAAYVATVVAENPNVRWTFVFMHRPTWKRKAPNNFTKIEDALRGRNYTMFAGHEHNYEHLRRHGRDYMQLGTTGGRWNSVGTGDIKNMDHITWVTMRDADEGGPVFAHLVATGILEKDGVPDFIPGAEFCGKHYDIECVYTKGN